MDRDAFVQLCKSKGLKVMKNGALKDMMCTYGTIGEMVVMDTMNKPYGFAMEDVTGMTYASDTRRVTFKLIDGSEFEIKGEFEHDEDGAIILNVARMPKEQSELDDLWDILFPNWESMMYYDVLTEQAMVDPALFNVPMEGEEADEDDDEKRFVPYTDDMVAFYYDILERRLKGMGFTGRCPTDKVRDMVFRKRVLQNKRNRFLERIEGIEWDGKPRMRRWFMDGLGATAPALTPEEEEKYIGDSTTEWFRGIISRMYKETKAEVVPVLIGPEGMGKGNFLRFTCLFNNEWFIDTSAPLEGPGAMEKFLEGVRGDIIVELSESTQFTTAKGSEILKTFVSQTRDKIRKPYAREPTVSIRRFSLIATSNRNNVFLDIGGGNRRYFPYYCDPNKAITAFDPQYQQVGLYEVEQLWAEVLHMYREDPQKSVYVSKETAELAAVMQDYGTVENTNVNRIDEWLDDPTNGYSEVGAMISKDEIFYSILGISSKDQGIVSLQATTVFREWADTQKCWRKLPKPLSVHGTIVKNVYERIYTSEDLKYKRRANMVNVPPGMEGTFVDTFRIMRERAKKYHFSKFDDPFPTEGLSAVEVAALCDAGYIYEQSGHMGYYLVAQMP